MLEDFENDIFFYFHLFILFVLAGVLCLLHIAQALVVLPVWWDFQAPIRLLYFLEVKKPTTIPFHPLVH